MFVHLFGKSLQEYHIYFIKNFGIAPNTFEKKKSLWLQYLITSFQQKGKKKSIPMASTSNNSSLLSDQDINQFLV